MARGAEDPPRVLRLEPSLAIGYNQPSRRGLKEPPGLEVLEGETPTAWEEKEWARRIPPCLAQGQGVLSATIAQHPSRHPPWPC